MPGWDVTVRPAKEEKKKDDNTTWVIVVVLLALLLLLLYGGGGQQQGPDRGPGQGCVQRDGSRCDQGLGSGGHRWDGRGSGHHDDDRDARDQRGP